MLCNNRMATPICGMTISRRTAAPADSEESKEAIALIHKAGLEWAAESDWNSSSFVMRSGTAIPRMTNDTKRAMAAAIPN